MAISKITSNSIDFSVGTSWQAVKTTNFTAVAGEGYFVNTTSGAITVTLPSSPTAGDAVVLKDYARTWATNNVTMASALFDGSTSSQTFSTSGQTITLVYIDGTRGWSLTNEDTTTNLIPPAFVTATGGTVTTSGDYKIHKFTGDGCFVVSCAGNPAGSTSVDYLVVAGGGGGGHGNNGGGGGGAGGFRESHSVPVSGCYTASPLATPTGITVTATTYPITVGGGAAAVGNPNVGNSGSPSVFSTITSAGGGGGGKWGCGGQTAGGSGGGSAQPGGSGAAGNTPPVSPPQGNAGGGLGYWQMGGGGGATAAGTPGHAVNGTCGGSNTTRNSKGDGGAGATTSISATPTSYAGGGGGGFSDAASLSPSSDYAPGGLGGGALGQGNDGTANTGGGGGGSPQPNPGNSGAGGSGIVIIRYKYQ